MANSNPNNGKLTVPPSEWALILASAVTGFQAAYAMERRIPVLSKPYMALQKTFPPDGNGDGCLRMLRAWHGGYQHACDLEADAILAS